MNHKLLAVRNIFRKYLPEKNENLNIYTTEQKNYWFKDNVLYSVTSGTWDLDEVPTRNISAFTSFAKKVENWYKQEQFNREMKEIIDSDEVGSSEKT